MIPIRHSPATTPSDLLKEAPPQDGISNRQWLSRLGVTDGILLLGGSSVTHFRIRVAQSQLRSDLLPSYWSLVGLLEDGHTFLSVPLDLRTAGSEIPSTNGVQTCQLEDYDDPQRFPNIAVLRFTNDPAPIRENVERIKAQRSVIDLPNLMLPWLGYIWGAGRSGNPLLEGHGLPSAAFVETAYGIAGIELTPGLSSAASCPEAMWQTAKWWRHFYEGTTRAGDTRATTATAPTGNYMLRQPAAAVLEPHNLRGRKP
jgi:hypothetical protein